MNHSSTWQSLTATCRMLYLRQQEGVLKSRSFTAKDHGVRSVSGLASKLFKVFKNTAFPTPRLPLPLPLPLPLSDMS